VVRAILAALDTTVTTPPTNVGTGRGTSVTELAEAVLEAQGREVPITYAEARPGEVRHSVAVVDALEDRFGIRAETALVDGLRTIRPPG
jgi:UDP-glucose 4-epimerase